MEAAAAIIAALAFVVSLFALRVAKQNADAADASANAADRSADAAKESARHAERIVGIESDREHDRRAPDLSGATWRTDLEPLESAKWRRLLVFTVPRPYVIQAYGISTRGHRQRLTVEPAQDLIHFDTEIVIVVFEQEEADQPEHLEVLFWPPSPGGRSQKWQCRCGRPTSPDVEDVDGHWKRRIPVKNQ